MATLTRVSLNLTLYIYVCVCEMGSVGVGEGVRVGFVMRCAEETERMYRKDKVDEFEESGVK